MTLNFTNHCATHMMGEAGVITGSQCAHGMMSSPCSLSVKFSLLGLIELKDVDFLFFFNYTSSVIHPNDTLPAFPLAIIDGLGSRFTSWKLFVHLGTSKFYVAPDENACLYLQIWDGGNDYYFF